MNSRRPPAWDATGLIEKAWKRLDPPTRDHLASLLRVKPTNLSKMNSGAMPLTLDYASRIAEVVPGISVADLGASSSTVAAAAPTVLDRLRALEVADERVTTTLERLTQRLAQLETQVADLSAPGQRAES